jgi:peroxiredoxin
MKRTEALMRKVVITLWAVGLLALWSMQIHADIGRSAPAFRAEDQEGRTVKLSDYTGKIVVLEWLNPECPFVRRHAEAGTMRDLAKRYREKGVVWIGVNTSRSSDAAANRAWALKNKLDYPILDDASSAIARAYGAKATPHMFVIDRGGKLAYGGAIDNDRDGEKGDARVNYVGQALDELLAGRAVSVPETAAYGCPVKYR